MEKVGRNQPCPCGSGEKYKKCCLKKRASSKPLDYLWHKLTRVNRELDDKLLTHATKIHERESIEEAWQDFSVYREEEEELDPESFHFPAFIHWYLYNWRPADSEEHNDYGAPLTIVESYLKKRKNRVPEMERKFIELAGEQPYSLYEIKEIRSGEGVLLRDLFLEKDTYVMDKSASEAGVKGCILFAKVIQYEHVGLMLGCSGFLMPPSVKTYIENIREEMLMEDGYINAESLLDSEVEITDLYFDICDLIDMPPDFNNAEGDPLCAHDMVFEIASAQIAFDKLKFLASGIPEEELLDNAEFYENGDIKAIDIPWLKKEDEQTGFGDTLGDIFIDEQKLKVFVNSEKRAEQIREKIENLLGDQVVHKTTEVHSMESLVDEAENKFEDEEAPLPSELMSELQKHMDKMIDDHWEQWIHEGLPALDGLSPSEAAKDPEGRSKLAAILKDIEMREKQGHLGVKQMKYVERARKQLGIDED